MNSIEIEFLIDNEMSPFDYQDCDRELVDIYKYFEGKFEGLYKSYSSSYNIENCIFYIKTGYTCNAFAGKKNGYNIIGITNGYPVMMKDKFDSTFFSKIILVGLLNEERISNAYAELHEEPEFKYDKFMLDCSIQYTFSHEFRHILQLNYCEITKDSFYNENVDTKYFSEQKHAREFDADRMATYEVIKFVFGVHRRLINRSDETLLCLFYCALSSMVITKNLFHYGVINQIKSPFRLHKTSFYTKENSHPHPLVRMYNIFDYFCENVRDDFPHLNFDIQEVLKNVMGISKLYFDSIAPEEKGNIDYFCDSQIDIDEINKYNQELYDFAIRDEAIRALLVASDTKFESE